MYFDRGLAESCRPNPISRMGIPTSMRLGGVRPFEVRYIQGAVRVPAGFGRVATVKFSAEEAVFQATSGQKLAVPVRHRFLQGD